MSNGSLAIGRLLGRGSIYTLAAAAPMLTGVLVTPVLTRLLDPAEYGLLANALVVLQFTVGLLALGLPVAITRHAFAEASGEAGARGIALTGAGLVALVSLIAATALGVGFGISGHLDWFTFALAVLSGGAGAGVAMAQAWAVAREDSWFYVALAFGTSLIAPVLGLVAVFWLGAGALNYFVAIALVYAVVEVAGYVRVIRSGPVAPSRKEFARSLRIGIPLVPHQLAVNSAAGAAVVIAGLMLGVESSGGAQVALYLGAVPVVIISAISYAWTPIVLSLPEEERGVHLAETAKAVTWLAALGGAALAVLSPWMIMLLTPSSYDIASMVPVAAVAAMAASFAAPYQANSQLVVASGRTTLFAVISPLAVVGGGLVSVALVRTIGLEGVGVGYVATYVLFAAFSGWLARRVSVVRWNEMGLLLPIAVGLGGAVLGSVLPWESLFGVTTRVVLGLVFLGSALQIFIREVRGSSTGR